MMSVSRPLTGSGLIVQPDMGTSSAIELRKRCRKLDKKNTTECSLFFCVNPLACMAESPRILGVKGGKKYRKWKSMFFMFGS